MTSLNLHRSQINRVAIALLTILVVFTLTACMIKQTPVAPGMIPRANTVAPEQEKFGENLYLHLSKDYKLATNLPQVDHLLSVFNHLKQVAEVDKMPWHIHLFDDPEVIDVRSVWGNYIFVWSGFLNATENDDEIAAILAYEMAHALTWHNMPVQYTVWSEILFDVTELATTLTVAGLSQGMVMVSGRGWMKWAYTELADLDPLDRVYTEAEEREATSIGLLILSRSRYSPEAMLTFWQRIQANEALQKKAEPLTRNLTPQQRAVMVETLLQQLPEEQSQVSNINSPNNSLADRLNRYF